MGTCMNRWLVRCAVLVGVFTLGAVVFAQWSQPQPQSSAAVVTRMREVARLETLDVTVYRKVTLEPDPPPSTSVLGDVYQFARHTVTPQRGRAIVFGDAHLGLDLSKLDADHVRIRGERIEVVLPPVEVKVELRPDETEIIGSNLDSAQTAQLLALGKAMLERDVRGDRALQQRARASAERALIALLQTLGFGDVVFIDSAPPLRAS